MTKYLVTGGAGFIGSNLVDCLLEKEESVRVFDNFSSGKYENLQNVSDRIELIEGDILSEALCREAVKGIECVFHQAALTSVPRSVKDPQSSNDVNTNGTLNLLIAARDAGVKRFIFASSSSVYGNTQKLPKDETIPPSPLSPYAVNKMACEHYLRIFHSLYGLGTMSLRYFNVFGPRQDPMSQYSAAIPRFVQALLKGKSPVVFGDGQQTRDFTYVDNVVQANLAARKAPESALGNVYNIAYGERTTVNQIISYIQEAIGSNIKVQYEPARPGDVLHSVADIEKARKDFAYEPKISLKKGLKLTVDWYKAEEKLS